MKKSLDKKITHIILNGAECEPYLTSDHRVMMETPAASELAADCDDRFHRFIPPVLK